MTLSTIRLIQMISPICLDLSFYAKNLWVQVKADRVKGVSDEECNPQGTKLTNYESTNYLFLSRLYYSKERDLVITMVCVCVSVCPCGQCVYLVNKLSEEPQGV